MDGRKDTTSYRNATAHIKKEGKRKKTNMFLFPSTNEITKVNIRNYQNVVSKPLLNISALINQTVLKSVEFSLS